MLHPSTSPATLNDLVTIVRFLSFRLFQKFLKKLCALSSPPTSSLTISFPRPSMPIAHPIPQRTPYLTSVWGQSGVVLPMPEKASGFVLQVNDVDIRPTKHIKVLGVLLDQTLSWEPHISSLVRRSNAILVSLFKIRHHLSPDILKILVQAHVFHHLQYCSSVWGGMPAWTDCRR